MTIQALTLDAQRIASAQNEANAIANSAHNNISSSTFVYFAAFDGTNNDKNNLTVSGNPLRDGLKTHRKRIRCSRDEPKAM
jgi:hypothetical protein